MSKNQIVIFDTTLRDGEQSPGCSMNLEEKLRMAQQLAHLKVDVIEAGFPIASPGDFDAVQAIAKEVKGPVICGLARANKKDIERCAHAIEPAKKKRIHTFISSSDIHLKYQLKKSREEVLEHAKAAVKQAKKWTDDVEFSAMDATRSDWDYLRQMFQVAIDHGATTLNIPDTVGYTIPSEFYELVSYLNAQLKGLKGVNLSVHCHNDLGLAVANSLAAIEAGATQVECTVNGIGERAGNCSLEEIVMALHVRQDQLNRQTKIKKDQIYPASKLLSSITGISVQPNKAIVGENAFAHESGIHQDGVLKNKLTYEIMTPATVGISKNKIVMGKHSGRHAFREKLKELGYPLTGDDFQTVFEEFILLADVKKEVYDEDIIALVDTRIHEEQRFELEAIQVSSGNFAVPAATVSVLDNGELKKAAAFGDGPVDAAFQAIKEITGFNGVLKKFVVNAITGGTDAQGGVFVTIEDQGRVVRATGSHTDIVVASAQAFIAAINRIAFYNRSDDRPEKLI
ncbi:MAG: 2-isopropylmalate synthase [Deltaproteobacteria bacterium]|nr:2-isopropylmalate synthase [Deltaproteobacteria bacterium]